MEANTSVRSAVFFGLAFVILTTVFAPTLTETFSWQPVLLWGASFILYLLVFTSLTKGFTLLALSEYMHQRYNKPPWQNQDKELSFQSLDGDITASFIETQVVSAVNSRKEVEKTSVKIHKLGEKTRFSRKNEITSREVDTVAIVIEVETIFYSERSDSNVRKYIRNFLNELAEQHGLLFREQVIIK